MVDALRGVAQERSYLMSRERGTARRANDWMEQRDSLRIRGDRAGQFASLL